MPTHTRPATSPARGDSTSNSFVIESRAWKGPSQLRIRKSDRIPEGGVQRGDPSSGAASRSGGCAPSYERTSEDGRVGPEGIPIPSRGGLGAAGEGKQSAVPTIGFTHPLRSPFSLSGTCSALPLSGVRFLAGPRESIPRLADECKAEPPIPMAARTDESKLRRFWRGSSPVAGPRRPRRRRAGKNAQNETDRIESPSLATRSRVRFTTRALYAVQALVYACASPR